MSESIRCSPQPSPKPKPSSERIYHEKQCKQMCALHALNNLFQSETAFTKSDLDVICQT